jgi:hypothetical protein
LADRQLTLNKGNQYVVDNLFGYHETWAPYVNIKTHPNSQKFLQLADQELLHKYSEIDQHIVYNLVSSGNFAVIEKHLEIKNNFLTCLKTVSIPGADLKKYCWERALLLNNGIDINFSQFQYYYLNNNYSFLHETIDMGFSFFF